MEVFVVLSTVLALVIVAPGIHSIDNSSILRRMIANCLASNDTMTCFSIKGIMALNRATRIAKFEILPGVTIRRDPTISTRSAKALSENEIINSLPAEESERSEHLFDLAVDSFANFMDSHSLVVKLPKESSQAVARAIEEGRIIKKKHIPKLALALALKALLLAKIALLSHFCKKGGGHKHAGYVKLVGGGGNENGAQTELSPGTSYAEQYIYDRAYDRAHDLAYNAHAIYIPTHD